MQRSAERVQRTLTAHLAPAHGALYWGEADLDLDEAELEDLDLTGALHARKLGGGQT